VVALLAGGLVVVAAVVAGLLSPTGGQLGPLAGVLGTGLVGMAVSGDGGDGIAALTEKVERARDGESVSFETDRDDGLGELAAAVDGLTDELDDCRRERELRERAIESAPVGIVVADATEDDYPMVAVNERFEAVTGYDESECLGRNCRFLQGDGTDEDAVAELRRAVEAGEETTVELRNYRKDGTEFWNRVRLSPVENEAGEVTHYVGFQEDVTERVEREAELERQGSLLDSIFEQLPVHIYVKDDEARHVRVSDAFFEQTGSDLRSEDLYGKTDVEVFDAEFAEESYEDDRQVIETGEPVVNREEYLDHIDEWNLTTKVPWRGSDGEIRGLLGVSRRITERKERERRLEQYQAYTDDVLDAIDDVFYVVDTDGDLRRWNETFSAVTGYSDDEIESMHAAEFFVEADQEAVRSGIANIDETQGVPLEARLQTKDGDAIPYEVVVSPLEDPDGERVIAGIARDISERKEQERQMAAIVENTADPIYIKDRDGRYQFINEAGAAVFDGEPDDIVGKTDEELFDEGSAAEIRADNERVVETGEPLSDEVVSRIDGEEHVFLDYKYPYRDEDGEIVGLVGISRDITERKETERELREREQRLEEYREYTEEILDAVDDVFYVLDSDGAMQRWNETLSAVTGYTDEEIASMHATDFFADDDRERVVDAIQTAIETGDARVEVPYLTASGEQIPFEFVASRIEDPQGDHVIVGIGRDASERKAAQRELREREQRLEEYREYTENILDAIDDVFYVFDETGRIQRWNDSLREVTGYTDAEIESMYGTEFFPADEHEQVAEATATVFETGEDRRVDAPVLTKDGEEIPYEFVATRLQNPDGDPVLVGVGRDVSERKAREREVREANERLNAIIEASPAALIALDFEDRVTLWNSAAERIFGWSEAEVLGEQLPIVPDDRADDHAEVVERVEDGEVITDVETRRRRKDGTLIDVSLSSAPLRDSDGEIVGTMGAFADVTERKEAARELRATKDRLQKFIETSPLGVVATDPEGEVTLWNDAMEEIFGWSADEVLGEPYPAVPDDREGADDVRQRVLDGETVTGVELERVRKDGELIDISLSTAPIRDEDGDVSEIVGYIEDITDRKERERELAARSAAMEQSIDGMAILDEDDRYEFVNRAHADIYGYDDPEAFLGESWELCYDEAELDRITDEVFSTLAAEGEWRGEALGTRADGTTFPQELSLTTLDDGRLICVVRDITERKEREHQLERTADLLSRAEEMADLGGWTHVVENDGLGALRWTDNLYDIFEVGEDEGPLDEELFELIHPDDREAHRTDNERAVEEGEPWDTEYRIVPESGTERWIHSICEPVVEDSDGRRHSGDGGDGETVELRGSVQDITERKERERELERTKDLLQQAGRIAAVGGWELDFTGEEPEMTWSDELYRIHGLSPDTGIDVDRAVELYHPDDRPQIRRYFQQAIEAGESYDMEVRLQPDGETTRWVRAIGEPVRNDAGEVACVRGSIQDITQQKERELALESLHEATRGLLGVEDDDEAAELVVDTARSVLDVAGVAVYLLDDTANQLDAVACSERFTDLCDADPVGAGASDSLLWNTYVTGRPTVFDDTQTVADSQVFGSEVSGGLLVPVGDHGVFVVATRDRAVDAEVRRLAETLVATTEAAFDRLASEETLRERDAELAAQNSRLRRQIQITDLLRRIDQSLIQAESREAVETAVCDQLVESDDVAFAWIGSLTAAGDRVEPSAWAGEGTEYLDSVSLSTDGSGEPAVTTALSEEPTVVGNVVDDLKRDAWRQHALTEEFHSVLSVPLAFEEYFYGVLTVYAGEPDAFGDLEREVFAELGETIAHSINAVETQRALHTDQRVELSLEFDAVDDVLGRLATEANCQTEFAGLAAHSEDETGLFVSVSAAPTERVTAALDSLVSVRGFRLVREFEGDDGDGESDATGALFEVTVDSGTLPARFVRHGARPQSIRASAAGIEAVVDVPTATDVRAFVEMLAETHPSVELTSRRSVDRTPEGEGGLAASLFESLTDRQLEVLRTAYFAGFFEWPRTSTGEDVAEMLDVSQPTVNRHLRLGQGRLLERLFEERSVDVAVEAD